MTLRMPSAAPGGDGFDNRCIAADAYRVVIEVECRERHLDHACR